MFRLWETNNFGIVEILTSVLYLCVELNQHTSLLLKHKVILSVVSLKLLLESDVKFQICNQRG